MMTLRASCSLRGCKNARMRNPRLTKTLQVSLTRTQRARGRLPWPQPASLGGAAVRRSRITSRGNAGVSRRSVSAELNRPLQPPRLDCARQIDEENSAMRVETTTPGAMSGIAASWMIGSGTVRVWGAGE